MDNMARCFILLYVTLLNRIDDMKKVLSLQDLSCYSKASNNIALPIYEMARLDVAILPTTILSTQTDGWNNICSFSLADEAERIAEIWRKETVIFDALQVGYLSGDEDIRLIDSHIFPLLSPDAVKILDPVLGDGGMLYGDDRKVLISHFMKMISKFDIITPNYTEACFLAGLPFPKERLGIKDAEKLVIKLRALGAKKGVITSVSLVDGYANLIFTEDDLYFDFFIHYDYYYPGSGDLFTSLLTVFILSGVSLKDAALKARSITSSSILYSRENGREYKKGILIFPALKALSEEI